MLNMLPLNCTCVSGSTEHLVLKAITAFTRVSRMATYTGIAVIKSISNKSVKVKVKVILYPWAECSAVS